MFWRWDGVTAAAQNSAEGDNALNVPTGSDVFQVPAHILPLKTPIHLHPACDIKSQRQYKIQDKAWQASIRQASVLVTAHFKVAWLLHVVFDCWRAPTCRVSSSPSHSVWLRTDQQWLGARRQAQEQFLQHPFPLQMPAAQALMLLLPLILLPAAPVRFLPFARSVTTFIMYSPDALSASKPWTPPPAPMRSHSLPDCMHPGHVPCCSSADACQQLSMAMGSPHALLDTPAAYRHAALLQTAIP